MSFIIPSAASRGGHGRLIKPDVAAPNEDSGSGSEVEPDFIEDYSSYSTITDLDNDIRDTYGFIDLGANAEFVTPGLDIDGYDLSKALRYWFRPGDGPPTIYKNMPSGLHEVWWEQYYRIDPNFTTEWGHSANADYKWMFMIGSSGRYETHIGVFDVQYTNSAPIGGTGTGSIDYRPDRDGEWHCVQVHWKDESTEGANDGTVEWLVGAEEGGRNIYAGAVGNADTELTEYVSMQFARWGANFNQYPGITSPGIYLDWGRTGLWYEGNNPLWSWQGGI